MTPRRWLPGLLALVREWNPSATDLRRERTHQLQSRSRRRAKSLVSPDFVPDSLLMAFLQVDRADHESQRCYDNGIDQSGVDIPSSRDESSRDERKKTAEPAVAEMIRQR